MALSNGKDYIYLIWHDRVNNKQFIVGKLSKNGKYEFEYSNEIDEALESGFNLLISFPEIKKYESDVLFPIFSSRLPDEKRSDIEEILSKYNLKQYDEYELLKASGAKLPIDDLMFIDPILNSDNNKITRNFYVAGCRHYIECQKVKNKEFGILPNDDLMLELEPNNPKDRNAIKVLHKGRIVGYIPRYYSEGIARNIKEGKI